MREVPFCKASLTEAEEKAVVEAMRSGWITKGPKTVEFEKKFAAKVNAAYAVGLNSCTAGLHLILEGLGVGPGDEVITTPVTFASTANVIIHTGAKVVFADVDPVNGNIDPNDVYKRITNDTKAVICVHLHGHPCEMDRLRDVCEERGIFLIEDAAHAPGADYKGEKCGSLADAASFSFYATKNITTGEGGMVTTHQADLAERIRVLSLHGLSKDAWKRYSPGGSAFYSVVAAGYKYNMNDLQAAMGLAQLERFDELQQRRSMLWQQYGYVLQGVEGIVLPHVSQDVTHACHIYAVRLKDEGCRDRVMSALREKGIYTQVHFVPLNKQPFYRALLGAEACRLKNAVDFTSSILSLPFYPDMLEEDLLYVADELKKAVAG